jgi:glycerate 2-kinase
VESLSSSLELVDFMKTIPEDAFVINLVSGGASSLFCLPADNLEIEDVRKIYSLLIDSGASIHEINTVRKVFSSVKGGQILQWLDKTTLIDLMISDITDDDIGMIGSGPSIAQPISATQAFQVLKKYNIYQHIPHNARHLLAVEMDSEVKDKDYRTTKDFERHFSFIISSASKMAAKASQIAESFGFEVHLDEKAWSGPIQDFEKHLIKQIDDLPEKKDKPRALINFGEPTVEVTGGGLGGRNQELALRMAINLKDYEQDICFLSAGTDGIDGPTNAAGAIVTNQTYEQAKQEGLDPEDYVKENDSYNFFDEAGGHIKSGPTGNNLMDLQITLVD